MDIAVLRRAMQNSKVPESYLPGFVAGMLAAGCTTPDRAAMWCAQVGHESVGLKFMEEIASGEAYNGRKDLGNVQPGDGPRYKGRGPIQLTGRHNYGEFGKWCKRNGFVTDLNYFVNNPLVVAQPYWGFLAAAWYWTVARPDINAFADKRDINMVTFRVNGGYNGLEDRNARYSVCLQLRNALLPTPPVAGPSIQQRMFLV